MSAKRARPDEHAELRTLGQLRPYPGNSRLHSPAQVTEIEQSIREFGWTVPILVDEENTILAGHGRVLAARSIFDGGDAIRLRDGTPLPAQSVPVLVARGWSDAQKRAYVIADNKTALNASWDEAVLAAELRQLQAEGFDMALTGFSVDELAVAVSGWESDIEKVTKAGLHTDGINSTIKVVVPAAHTDTAREAIRAALTAAEVPFEL